MKVIRNVVDPWDQLVDIQHAIDFVTGDPGVDRSKIGYWGSSYSGGHAVWLAAHESRLAASYGQVPAAASRPQVPPRGGDDRATETRGMDNRKTDRIQRRITCELVWQTKSASMSAWGRSRTFIGGIPGWLEQTLAYAAQCLFLGNGDVRPARGLVDSASADRASTG